MHVLYMYISTVTASIRNTDVNVSVLPGVHNKKNVRGRSVNRPRINRFFYLRSLASGYTIFKSTTPNQHV